MHIDHYLNLCKQHASLPNQSYTLSSEWSQGRTVYGGISAGMLYCAAKSHVESSRLLRSMSTNFVGPLLAKEAFTISVEIIRSGKNVSQIQARAIQNGKVCVLSQFCFAQGRKSKVAVENNEKHAMTTPSKAKFIPQIPKVTPKFLRHFDLSIEDGGLPFLGSKKSHYFGWMRYTSPPEIMSEAHLISIIDAWPPTVLQMLRLPAPASTVSWNLELVYPHKEILPTDWFAYKAHTRQAADGYGHTEASIWDAHGELVAISRQTVAVFD